jgi:sulfite reductase alpha subunit-like flavoprotein
MPVPNVLNKPLKLVTIATQYWDLNAIPRARAFEVLAQNCDNELEKDRLLEFAGFEGQQELISYANRPRKTIIEVLEDFPNATSKLTLNLLFELFQPIKQRPFSIASSMISNRLDLLVAVVEYRTRLHNPRRGLCSTWMKTLNSGDRVRVSIKNGTFKLPKEIDRPFVMVDSQFSEE